MARADLVWPLYFAKKPLDAKRVKLKAGQVFPVQDKHFIRGLARAYGVENPEAVAFGELPYVAVLNCGTEDVARQIIERNLALTEAKKVEGVKV